MCSKVTDLYCMLSSSFSKKKQKSDGCKQSKKPHSNQWESVSFSYSPSLKGREKWKEKLKCGLSLRRLNESTQIVPNVSK